LGLSACVALASAAGLLGHYVLSADVGRAPILGLPAQRASFRPAPPDISVEVPVEQQQEVAPF
jgi:hypothetical protein